MSGPDPDVAGFCRAEHRRLVGALALVVGDVHVAEELAQEALLRADRQWRRVRDFDAPATWLLTVTMNLARSHLRRRLAARRAAVRMGPLDTVVEPPAVADHVAVRDAVAELPRRHRSGHGNLQNRARTQPTRSPARRPRSHRRLSDGRAVAVTDDGSAAQVT